MGRMTEDKKPKEWKYEGKPISLHGLDPEEALGDLLATGPPPKKPKKAEQPTKKSRS